ncbi:glycosyl transferase family 2 [Nonlabens sp. YIK11]|uniref:glycosyltransferase family 2 protein n=1 Tax=Nonlabens sp. YIK11 TaxID=1453349 RepID=UPI0006DCCFC6|nr:glycosyltransferase [Nonlabens sp. YIK11]KQC34128.1 glycosyl transferase family 2 [Nonlabens sp. YIK11]
MIILEYKQNKICAGPYQGKSVLPALYDCARENPEEPIVVKERDLDGTLFIEALGENLSRNLFISNHNPLNQDFGYVEDSPFLKISKTVKYPTWIKGTSIFYIHAALVNQVSDQLSASQDLLYWVNSLGKLAQSAGVFTYQLPYHLSHNKLSDSLLYQFVQQHYKRRWTLLLLLCHILYEKRFPWAAFAKAQFFKTRKIKIDAVVLQKKVFKPDEFDLEYEIIIPTLGRPDYLYQVLKDIARQTIQPKKIIIIEQNADSSSKSELYYLEEETWPFQMDHQLIHRTGSCHARNLAISKTTAPWVMFFDDDARFDKLLFEKIFQTLKQTGLSVINTAYLQNNDQDKVTAMIQWKSFGSGCSMVNRDVFEQCSFDLALEHGYGEDADYGMQIRNAGYDVIYTPQIQILHLKAPVGGFRSEFIFPWQFEKFKPKPSPQIMYFRRKNTTLQQLQGYKLVLFFKFYRGFGTSNPIKHYRYFRKAWDRSVYWSHKLSNGL